MNISRESVDAIKNLSVPEKVLIVEEIWDSIARGDEYPELTVSQKEELSKRIDSYHQYPEQGRSWEEIKRDFWESK